MKLYSPSSKLTVFLFLLGEGEAYGDDLGLVCCSLLTSSDDPQLLLITACRTVPAEARIRDLIVLSRLLRRLPELRWNPPSDFS